MIYRILNEFIRESVCLALEPARHCVSGCTYCFASLNSRSQYAGRSKSDADDGSFERTLEKAYSPSYDPTDFLQWGLRERLPLGFSNTAEPYQDVTQARNTLKICQNFDLPLFIQTKGLNFDQVSDYLIPIIGNASFFVSLPSLDDRVVKRFEPGTPPLSERLRMIDWLVERGAWVIAALSPYHEEFCQDPEQLVDDLASHGISEIFLDRLHLNQRQYASATDKVMRDMAGGCGRALPPLFVDHMKAIHGAALGNNLEFFANSFMSSVYGLSNTIPTITPDEIFERGNPWPYHDGLILHLLETTFYGKGADGEVIQPIARLPEDGVLLYWDDCIAIMERNEPPAQEFSYSSLYDVIPIGRKLTDVWTATLKPTATMAAYYRALWNNPYLTAFVWRHPWIAVVAKPDGTPWLDDGGNLIGLFDPDILDRDRKLFRRVESIDEFRRLEFTFTPSEDDI